MALRGFDTHEAVKGLTDSGFSEGQAESIIITIRKAIGTDLATKTELESMKTELKMKFESEIKSLELRMTLRLGGLMIAASGLTVALIKLLP